MGVFEQEDWRGLVERLWDRELADLAAGARGSGIAGSPASWPGYQLKRARLFHVAGRVHELLRTLPVDALVLTEEVLIGAEGRLYGRPDVLIRGEHQHLIIDYKSGGVVDRETNRPREAYVHQLQLYAYLENEASGSWPSAAYLFPLQGPPVEIDVDPGQCCDLAARAVDVLDSYNALVPGCQPASPTPSHCRWCPYSVACGPFWEACDESWSPAVVAAAGVVSRAFATPIGGVTAFIKTDAGSVREGLVAVKNIDPGYHPESAALSVGDEMAAVGLIPDLGGSGFWLGQSGLLSVCPAGPPAGGPGTYDRRNE